jgi:hypothetical protein
MATLQSLTVNDTGNLTLPNGTTAQRPSTTTNIVQWTNTGTQAVSVLAGSATTTTTSWTCPAGVTSIEVIVVAGGGGGGGGNYHGGGGGAGGLIYNSSFAVTPTTVYSVTVGAGGNGGVTTSAGSNGSNSIFGTLTAIGGGGGGVSSTGNPGNGVAGGSGGGASGISQGNLAGQSYGGAGTLGQGNRGGQNLYGYSTGTPYGGTGGGGAGGCGLDGLGNGYPQQGGPGLVFNISGTSTYYAGGGGGASYQTVGGASGGAGGGGTGGNATSTAPTAGTASTGGGGGGAERYSTATGGAGGSGIIIIRYSVTNSVQPIGQLRFNTSTVKLEHFGSNNQWNITDGLVLNLDVGNTASYSGSGSTWNDLANGNTFTLTASPTYGGSSAAAYLTFNGSTQYATAANIIDFSSSTFSLGHTIEVWCYPTGANNANNALFNTSGGTSGGQWQTYLWYNYTNYFGSTQRFINKSANQDQNDFSATTTSAINNWYHVVLSCNNTSSTLYINGVQVSANVSGQPFASPDIILGNGGTPQTRVGSFYNYAGNYFTGRIAVVNVYSKPLGQDQILQNFNALRGRYGL